MKAALVLIFSWIQAIIGFPTPCCLNKEVGGVDYQLVKEEDTSAYNCLANCIYEKVEDPGRMFCFASGNQTVVCEDEEVPATTTSTSCRCGMKKKEARIVGGQDAEVNEYPWMVALTFQTSEGNWFCGGSIINSKWIITAQHCVVTTIIENITELLATDLEAVPASSVIISIGEHQLSKLDETNKTRHLQCEEIVLSGSVWFDFALLKVAEDIDIRVHTPVCLPYPDDEFTSRMTVITGWGLPVSTSLDNAGNVSLSDVLQEIELPTTTASMCSSIITSAFNFPVPNYLCFGDGQPNKSPCFGDSGSPLIVRRFRERAWTLAGIVSGGTSEICASGGAYGLALEVAKFVDIIKTTTADGEFCNK